MLRTRNYSTSRGSGGDGACQTNRARLVGWSRTVVSVVAPPPGKSSVAALLRFLARAAWVVVLIGCGCAGGKGGAKVIEPRPGGPQVIVTPSSSVLGKVLFVDTPGRFVVLSFPPGRLPDPGRKYSLYRRGLKVGQVRIGGPQRGDNIVADVVTGEAEAGDEARPE